MLKNSTVFASFSVDDINVASNFYKQTLGLEVSEKMGGLMLHFAGGNQCFVYPKDDHNPATYTVLNFTVNDVEKAVDELTTKGIKFEKYNEGMLKTNDKGISVWENGPTMAWFKDPAGNFLSLIKE